MSSASGQHPKQRRERQQRNNRDLFLVKAVLSGSVDSWSTLVDRYSGLILSVLRQQLFAEDEDEIQNVYVDVLEAVYKNKLREYKGKASLATWLVLVTRGKAVDYVRKKRGRRTLPKGYKTLSARDRKVMQLHFVEGVDFDIVLQILNSEHGGYKVEDVVASVERIVKNVDGRYLRRLDRENDARRQGIHTGKLAEYLLRAETEIGAVERYASKTPEQELIDAERERAYTRLNALKARLPEADQELLNLRYEQGYTAREISEKLNMGGQRKVYSDLERALRRLKKAFLSEEQGGQGVPEDFSGKNRGENDKNNA